MSDENDDEKKSLVPLRILMVGPTGSGKSSTANTIVMAAEGQTKKLFRTGHTTDPITRWNEEYTRSILGREVTVVDTPGADNVQDDPVEILKEIRAAIENSEQPYDAILYVVSVFENKLQLDDLTLRVFKLADQILGAQFWNHCVLVFTFGDSFIQILTDRAGKEYEIISFDEFIRRDKTSRNTHAIGPYVKLVHDAAVLLDNKTDRGASVKIEMVENLLKKVEGVKARNNDGGFHTAQLRPDPQYPKPRQISDFEKAWKIAIPHLKIHWKNYLILLLVLMLAVIIGFAKN